MHIGIRLHDTREGTLAQRLNAAHDQGFSCAHLAMSKAVPGFQMNRAEALLTRELAEEVRGAFEKENMECAVLGCYLKLAEMDEEKRERVRALYRAHFRFARMIGARVVGSETPAADGAAFSQPVSVSEEAFSFFLRCLAPLVRDAEEENAVFAIEPVFSHIVSTPERAERMLDAVRSDHLQIILDAVNLLGPETVQDADAVIEDAIRRLGGRVKVLHMKDFLTPEKGDGALKCCACGLGQMRYGRLLRFAKDGDLPMTLENTCPDNAENARKYLEKLSLDC
ncbi:MAG: sugar phosphate isomerase/epimerase [Clostridiales bacterium]|nr:sugar phosphate isomerase/epimerase [Clostridiales bacterium]